MKSEWGTTKLRVNVDWRRDSIGGFLTIINKEQPRLIESQKMDFIQETLAAP